MIQNDKIIIPQEHIDFIRSWANRLDVINGHSKFDNKRTTSEIIDSIFLGKLGEWATTLYYRATGWVDFPEPDFGNGDDGGKDFNVGNGIDTKALWRDEVASGKKSKVFLPGSKNFKENIRYILFLIDRNDNYSAECVGSKLGKELKPAKSHNKSFTFVNSFKDTKIYDNLLSSLDLI